MQLCDRVNILWHWPTLRLEWKLVFSSHVAIAEFSKFAVILSAALSQHYILGFEITQPEFHPYSTYLTYPPQEMGGPILWE